MALGKDLGDAPGLDKFGRFHNRRELDALRPILEPGEGLLHVLEAWSGPKQGVLASTDRRVIFVVAGMLRDQAQSWSYDELQQVRVGVDVDEAVVFLRTTEGREVVFAKCPRKPAQAFAEALQQRPKPGTYRKVVPVADAKDATPVDDPEPPVTDAEQRLERLERMFKRGSMSEPEYRVAKRRILEHNEIPVRKPRPEGAPKPGETIPLGAPGSGDAPPGTEVIQSTALPEGTDPMGGYTWSKGGGMTTKAPVQTAEDPEKVFETPPAEKKDKDGAAATVEFEAVPDDFKPVPTAKKSPVAAAVQPTAAKPIQSARKGPVEVEGDPLKEALGKPAAAGLPRKGAGGDAAEAKDPKNKDPKPKDPKANEPKSDKDDDNVPNRPRVWPPLPGKE